MEWLAVIGTPGVWSGVEANKILKLIKKTVDDIKK